MAAASTANPTVFLLMVSGQIESAQVGQRAAFVQRLPEWLGEPPRFFCFPPSGGPLGISRPGAAYAVAHSKSNLGGLNGLSNPAKTGHPTPFPSLGCPAFCTQGNPSEAGPDRRPTGDAFAVCEEMQEGGGKSSGVARARCSPAP